MTEKKTNVTQIENTEIELDKVVIYDRIIGLEEVKIIVGFSHSKIYTLMKEGKFPKKHPCAPGWVLSAVLLFVKTGEVESIAA